MRFRERDGRLQVLLGKDSQVNGSSMEVVNLRINRRSTAEVN